MTETAMQLREQVLQLSEEDRVAMARAIWGLSNVARRRSKGKRLRWVSELNRRADDLAAGRMLAEPADQVLAELREECLRENPRC